MNEAFLQIAIDGPVASGKGAVSFGLAKKLGLLYINTGAMYRALALACIEHGISLKDESSVLSILSKHTISFGDQNEILLDGKNVTERITYQDTAQGASDVGSLGGVRSRMVIAQQKLAEGKRVVMEGRDIALRVLPNAQLKIYLTASVEERARRRHADWLSKGIQKTYESTLEDTKIRDLQDMTRRVDPLQKVDGVWELDTTGMTLRQVIDTIVQELHIRGLL